MVLLARRMAALGLLLTAVSGCSLQRLAQTSIVDMLVEGGSEVFSGESDVELVGDALPFALKLYESVLSKAQDDPRLHLATAQAFALYARAYVQQPAEMLPADRFEERKRSLARAKGLYLRARDYALRGLDLRRPGLGAGLLGGEAWQEALGSAQREDAGWLYWAAAAWLGALSADPFDLDLLLGARRAADMLGRVIEVDEGYDDGGAHELLVSYYGSIPAEMGGSEQLAREHFARAVALSRGTKASCYVALATAVSVKKQDSREFRELLAKALAVDLDSAPSQRLANAISRRYASWLLEHVEDFFLEGGSE